MKKLSILKWGTVDKKFMVDEVGRGPQIIKI